MSGLRQEGLFGAEEVPAAPAAPEAATGPYARVALDTPVRQEFSYRLPEAMRDVEPGCRVRVPFGSRSLVGVVVGIDPHPPEGVAPARLRAVGRVLDEQPLLPPALLRLARAVADRTFCSWGQALSAMLPAALRRDQPRRSVPTVEPDREPEREELAELEKRHPKQERALAWLRAAGGPVEVREFQNRTGLSRSPLESLQRRGLVRFRRQELTVDPFAGVAGTPDVPPELTDEQARCVEAVKSAVDAHRHEDFLLFGVTGSGKTEVYLRALARALEKGRGAIVVVPEISLTPQTVARFRARCGEVAVLHSGLTDAERRDQWIALKERRLRVVVGARSALFAPIPDLGLIVVDEEHETSFKQESTPRYHARDVARERARLEGAVCILGSATPSLESWQEARKGRLCLLELPSRVAGGRLPSVEVVDMREQPAERGHWSIVSEPLRRTLAAALAREERAILFLNQRGFAPAWHCRNCGESVQCKTCDVSLTYHRWRKRAQCHYCLQESPPPEHCPKCRKPVSLVGVGTERVEDAVRRLFPAARVARMDRDTMVRRASYEEILRAFGAGEIDILLGTQMVAKGLDFPEVTVVGVLNADTALHQPDFRAAERCFNLVAQVSGRAGRGERAGHVVVQSWIPEHPAIRAAAEHDYVRFATGESEERRAFRYPPYSHGVWIHFEDADAKKVEERAAAAGERIRAAADGADCTVLGPAIPPIERVRGRHRRQILVRAPSEAALRPLHAVLYELCQKQGTVVDPL